MSNHEDPDANQVSEASHEGLAINGLPVDIIIHIAENLAEQGQSKTLAALNATSKANYQAVLPLLYRRISLNNTSVKLFLRLHDEVRSTIPLKDVDRLLLHVLQNPDQGIPESPPRTSAIDRFHMVESILIEGGLQAAARTPRLVRYEDSPELECATATGIPVLCPRLKSIVFPESFIATSQNVDDEGTEAQQLIRGQTMWDVCAALEALLQPRTVVLYVPKYASADACDRSESLATFIECFGSNVLRSRSLVIHNAVSIPTEALTKTSNEVHISFRREVEEKDRCLAAMEALVYTVRYTNYFDGRIIMHESLPDMFDSRAVDDYPYASLADSTFAEMDDALDPSRRSLPEGLNDADYDNPERLQLSSPFREAMWTLARALEGSRNGWDEETGIRTWLNWSHLRFPWDQLYKNMQTRFAVVGAIYWNEFGEDAKSPELASVEGEGY